MDASFADFRLTESTTLLSIVLRVSAKLERLSLRKYERYVDLTYVQSYYASSRFKFTPNKINEKQSARTIISQKRNTSCYCLVQLTAPALLSIQFDLLIP